MSHQRRVCSMGSEKDDVWKLFCENCECVFEKIAKGLYHEKPMARITLQDYVSCLSLAAQLTETIVRLQISHEEGS